MSIKSYITSTFLKKICKDAYSEIVYPMAKSYVEKTDNSWDDKGLEFLDAFIGDFLNDLDSDEAETTEEASTEEAAAE